MQKKILGKRHRCLDLRAYGAQAQRDTPEKNPSYGLACSLFHFAQEWTRSPAGEPILVHEWTRPHG